jgi:hypothetical protein
MTTVHKDLLQQSPLLVLPVIAMLVFFAVFVAVTLRTMLRRSSAYEKTAALPLSEENRHE